MWLKKKVVNIFFMKVELKNNGYVILWYGVVIGIYLGIGNLFVVWDDGSSGQFLVGYSLEILWCLMLGEEGELKLFIKEVNDSVEVLCGFIQQ